MQKPSNLRFALAPVAAALFPVVYLYTHNIESVPFAHTTRALAVVLASALLVHLLLARLMRSPAKAAIVQTAFTVVFFLFGTFVRYEQPVSEWRWEVEWLLVGLYGFYVFATALVAVVVARARGDLEVAGTVLGVVAASILLMPVLSGAYYEAFVRQPVRSPAGPPATAPPAEGPRPDVYYVVLDGYSRHDVLEALYGVDNAPFLSALEARGFRVARGSRSNYLETALSLGSSLNLTYLDEVARREGDSKNRWQLARMIQNSEVSRILRGRGYRFVNLPSGCYLTSPNPTADLEPARHGVSHAEYESALFRMTPLARLPWVDAGFAIWATGERDRVLFQFEALASVPREAGPTFVLAHIMSPHPPFVFDADGGAPKFVFPISGNDGDQFEGPRDHRYITCYADQVRFLNRKVLEVVDAILARYPEGERPVIIIQSDHGGGLQYHGDDKEQANLWERSGILNAYLLPENGRFEIYDTITPVNSFRAVFNGLWGTGYEMLEDRTFYAPHERPYAFSEVLAAEIEADQPATAEPTLTRSRPR